MEGLLNTKPSNHHDFTVGDKKDKTCAKCGEVRESHVVYERVRVVGTNGTYMAWRLKEGK